MHDKKDCIRIDPEERLCAEFDYTSIAKFPVAKQTEMGLPILDDCAHEHIM